MSDALKNPAYSTSVGLLKLGLIMDLEDDRRSEIRKKRDDSGAGERVAKIIKGVFGRLLPGEEDEG